MPRLYERKCELPSGVVRFREYYPTGPLAGCVRCFWTFAASTGRWDHLRHIVLPDGCTDLLFTFGPSPKALVIGPMTLPRVLPFGSAENIAVSFFPGHAQRMMNADLSVLQDRTVPLSEFWPAALVARLLDRLATAVSLDAKIAVLKEEILLASRRSGSGSDDTVEQSVRWMYDTEGVIGVKELSSKVGLCARQLQRRVASATGYSPKELLRILRFQHALSAWLHDHDQTGADLAARFGFSDQAHLIRDFQEMATLPPRQLLTPSKECPIFSIPTGWSLGYNRRR